MRRLKIPITGSEVVWIGDTTKPYWWRSIDWPFLRRSDRVHEALGAAGHLVVAMREGYDVDLDRVHFDEDFGASIHVDGRDPDPRDRDDVVREVALALAAPVARAEFPWRSDVPARYRQRAGLVAEDLGVDRQEMVPLIDDAIDRVRHHLDEAIVVEVIEALERMFLERVGGPEPEDVRTAVLPLEMQPTIRTLVPTVEHATRRTSRSLVETLGANFGG